MQLKSAECKGCEQYRPIVNRKHHLCQECNTRRLNPNGSKIYTLKRTPLKPNTTPLKRSTKPIAQRSKKSVRTLKLDEETYELVYRQHMNDGSYQCENCDMPLDPRFRDEEGRIVQRFRYSHILSKGAYPMHRHNPLNFNFLCFNCHQLWEFGGEKGRRSMRIFMKNVNIIMILHKSQLPDSQIVENI